MKMLPRPAGHRARGRWRRRRRRRSTVVYCSESGIYRMSSLQNFSL
jgi:hypothetical protein